MTDLADSAATKSQKLGPERIATLMDEAYPSVYFTLLSIIQGIALGTMIVKASAIASQGDWPTAAILVFNGTILIAYVWIQYLTAGLMYAWTPRGLDQLLPFIIGFLEAASMLVVTRPPLYFLALAALALVGIVEHLDMMYGLYQYGDAFTDSDALAEECRQQRSTIRLLGLVAIALLGLGAGVKAWEPAGLVLSVFLLVPGAFLVVYYLVFSAQWHSLLAEAGYGWSRPFRGFSKFMRTGRYTAASVRDERAHRDQTHSGSPSSKHVED